MILENQKAFNRGLNPIVSYQAAQQDLQDMK